MSLLDKRTASDAVKLMVFIVVTTVATSLLVITIGNLSFSAMKEYKAVFSDATGVVNGDDVRIAGVKVGNVEDVEIVDKDKALVTFKVDADSQLARSTQATDPVPQPGRSALHRADPGARARRRCSPTATPSRSSRPRRRST